MKKMTIKDIIGKEQLMSFEAEKRYGKYFVNALGFNALLQNFIVGVKTKAWIFVAFLSQVRKHHTLALLSTIRLHRLQAMMVLRQTLESGANAAYAIANPNEKDFAEKDPQGLLMDSQTLTNKRYKWLEIKFPCSSNFIRNMKREINKTSTHSNIISAYHNFKLRNDGIIETPFFDFENDFQLKTDFWLIGNIALGLMDLFYGVNRDFDLVTFSKDFAKRLHELEEGNNNLKEELTRHKPI